MPRPKNHVLALFLATFAPTPALATQDNGLRLSFGGGPTNRWVGGKSELLVGTELTLTFVPLVSLSTGAVFSEHAVNYAYGEAGLYFIASLAAGLGYGAYSSSEGRQDGLSGHLFNGIPIPLANHPFELIEEGTLFPYLLPYYRPSWGPWPGTSHELGLMFKLNYGLTGQGFRVGS